MKRFAIVILFAFFALCAVARSADRCNYAITILKPNKEPLYNAHLYLYAGQSDNVGRIDIVAKYGVAGVAITPEGKMLPFTLMHEQSVVASPTNQHKRIESPHYIVNGKFIDHFNPDNYTSEQLSMSKVSYKWNKKVAKATDRNPLICKQLVTLNGVVFATLKQDVSTCKPEEKNTYTLNVLDNEGKAIEGAQIYLLSRRTNKAGEAELTTHKGRKAIITHPNTKQGYIDYTFDQELEPTIIFDKPITVRLAGYSGGLNNFRRELSKIIEFPDVEARGEVRASFVVGKKGTIENIKIVKTINRAFTEEVVTKLLKMPPWRPAMKDGEAVKCSYTLPLQFRGNDD